MPEIRIDPLTGFRAIVAGDRAQRPGGGLSATPAPVVERDTDPFAEGHEDRTPPEVYAVRPNGGPPDTPGWTVRVVPNLYPALSDNSPQPEPDAKPDLFWAGPAHGAHEVIVNAPDTVSSLSHLTPDQVVGAVEVWRERIRTHDEASYVHVIVNERREAGASLPHTHAQLYALDFVPAGIARERERFGAYATRTMGGNLLADLVQEEVRRRERIVAIDDEAVLMAPYGSRVPFQLMIAPRTPRARFEDDGPTGARMLHQALSTAGGPTRREPAAQPVGADGATRGRALLLADRHPAAPRASRRPRAGGRREHEHRPARTRRRRAARLAGR